MNQRLPNIHPREVVWKEFMLPHNLTQNALARAIEVSPCRINEIIHAKRAITADTALRLSDYFGTTAQFWLGLQDDYELEEARLKLKASKSP